MKVLHVTNLYPFEEEPTFGVFVKEQVESLKNPNFQDVFFINARKKGFREYFRAVKDLKKIINNYDVMHCHHQFSTITAYLANPNAKIITAILGDIGKRSWFNKKVYNIAEKISRKIIFKNKLPSSSGKNVLLPNGVNLEIFKELDKCKCRNTLELKQDQIYVLFVCNGSLDNPIKRHDKFLNVIEKLNKMANQKKYIPLYLSNVNREMVPEYFNAADFMLLASDHEGSPNAVKEAMACNLPIVTTPVGDVSILLNQVYNSFVAQKGTVQELFKLSSRIEYTRRSNGRQKLIELSLDADSVALKLKNLYNSL